MELATFLLFLITTAVVVFSPGPAALTAATQGSGNGVKYAVFGVLGIASANTVHFALSATGIATLVIASQPVFLIIKWVGVTYLIYLGLSAILSKSGGFKVRQGKREKRIKLYSKGFIVEFANPKALLYFAAILPQFINLEAALLPQILIMGSVTIFIDIVIYTAYAFLGHRIVNSGVSGSLIKIINRMAGSGLLFAAYKMSKVHS